MEDMVYKVAGVVITIVVLTSLAVTGFKILGGGKSEYVREVAESIASIIREMSSSTIEYKMEVYKPPADMMIRVTDAMVEVNSTKYNAFWRTNLNLPAGFHASGTVENANLVCLLKERNRVTITEVSSEKECIALLEQARESYYG